MSWTSNHEPSLPPEPGPHHLPAHDDAWWAAVRVGSVAVSRHGTAADAGATVRACVELGALAPADVRVHVVGEGASAGEASVGSEGVRLWSTQSFDNGTFVFEAHVPAELVHARDAISVRVRPAPTGVVRVTLRPIVHRCALERDVADGLAPRGPLSRSAGDRWDVGDAARA